MKGTKTLLSYILFIIGLQWKSVAALPECLDSEFQCKNGRCLKKLWFCDNSDDCGDNSDEERCTANKGEARCPIGQFRCGVQQCVPVTSLCDGVNDCADKSDESKTGGAQCTVIKCADKNSFKCNQTDFCISPSYRCDGVNDCSDRSDEIGCETQTCKANEFQCHTTKRCISLEWRCNYKHDCGEADTSDEKDCNDDKCADGRFKCLNSGHCINQDMKCNGVRDCLDGSDEFKCPKNTAACESDEFKCETDGRCIKSLYRCDMADDCLDGSDERDCDTSNHKCGSNYFRCGSGHCIYHSFKCDGENECPDDSDELECNQNEPKVGNLLTKSTTPSTTSWQTMKIKTTARPTNSSVVPHNPCIGQAMSFYCPEAEGTEDQCIEKSWVCDGENDCPSGRDEWPSTCARNVCGDDMFKCTNGECVLKSRICDGYEDCKDDSDEAETLCYPTHAPVHCGNSTYKCQNSTKCIPMSSVCNDLKDCPLEDDERKLCDVEECYTKNGGCSHTCHEMKLGYKCMCPEGLQLFTDGHTCVDIDECKLGWEVTECSQLCMNLKGSYKCKCVDGYNLDQTGKKCRAEAPIPYIIFADKLDIRQIENNGNHYNKIAETEQTSSVAVDVSQKMIYWAEKGAKGIFRAHRIANTKKEKIVSGGLKKPESLAVDWIGRNLYWIDTGLNSISVSNLDGSLRKIFLQGGTGEQFRALAVYPAKAFIFWTDISNTRSKIERANLDGTERKILYENGDMPVGIVVDTIQDKVYWTDMKLGQICSMNFDGSDFKIVLKDIDSPFGVSVFEDYVYWTSKNQKKIYKANKFSGKEVVTFEESLFSPMDLVVYHPLTQVQSDHPCNVNNGGCSHLCLVASSHTAVCACPDGMVPAINSNSCINAPNVVTIPVADVCAGYKCHSSAICLNSKLVCDRVSHCPEQDDETGCIKNQKNTVALEKSTSSSMYVILAASLGGFILLAVLVIILFRYRKKKNRFDLSIVYETERNAVHSKEASSNKADVEVKYVLPTEANERNKKNNKNFDNVNYTAADESKVPLHIDDYANSSEDNSSGDLCYEDDDRRPIMDNIV